MDGGFIYMTEERTNEKVGEMMRRRSDLKKRRLALKDDISAFAKIFEVAAAWLKGETQFRPFDPASLPEKSAVIAIWTEYRSVCAELTALESDLTGAGIDIS
jgi:hypothetical protein